MAIAAGPLTFVSVFKTSSGQSDDGFVVLEPTPAVGDDLEPTLEETSGPYFRPDSPLKQNFREAGIRGVPLQLSGTVLDLHGRPVPGALLDFWHADSEGEYDLKGFRFRGHQFSDSRGRYLLETIVPGLYPTRTRHFHVRLQAPHGPIRATQLYFPGEPQNASDLLFRPELLLKITEGGIIRLATFQFALKTVS